MEPPEPLFDEIIRVLENGPTRIAKEERFKFKPVKPTDTVRGVVGPKIRAIASLAIKFEDETEECKQAIVDLNQNPESSEFKILLGRMILLNQKTEAVWSFVWTLIFEEVAICSGTMLIRKGWKVISTEDPNETQEDDDGDEPLMSEISGIPIINLHVPKSPLPGGPPADPSLN